MENIVERLARQVAFIKEIDKVKYIFRKTRLFHSERHENDAEHSWHLAVMAMVLAEHSNVPIDMLKVIKMVLIHDLVEIDAGDTFLYDTAKSHSNTEQERLAAKRVFGMLPADQTEAFMGVWDEFERGDTPEAKFARALDRFEPLLQNASNNGGTLEEFQIDDQRVFEKKKVIKYGSASLWEYARTLLRECVEAGILRQVDNQN